MQKIAFCINPTVGGREWGWLLRNVMWERNCVFTMNAINNNSFIKFYSNLYAVIRGGKEKKHIKLGDVVIFFS